MRQCNFIVKVHNSVEESESYSINKMDAIACDNMFLHLYYIFRVFSLESLIYDINNMTNYVTPGPCSDTEKNEVNNRLTGITL